MAVLSFSYLHVINWPKFGASRRSRRLQRRSQKSPHCCISAARRMAAIADLV